MTIIRVSGAAALQDSCPKSFAGHYILIRILVLVRHSISGRGYTNTGYAVATGGNLLSVLLLIMHCTHKVAELLEQYNH